MSEHRELANMALIVSILIVMAFAYALMDLSHRIEGFWTRVLLAVLIVWTLAIFIWW